MKTETYKSLENNDCTNPSGRIQYSLCGKNYAVLYDAGLKIKKIERSSNLKQMLATELPQLSSICYL